MQPARALAESQLPQARSSARPRRRRRSSAAARPPRRRSACDHLVADGLLPDSRHGRLHASCSGPRRSCRPHSTVSGDLAGIVRPAWRWLILKTRAAWSTGSPARRAASRRAARMRVESPEHLRHHRRAVRTDVTSACGIDPHEDIARRSEALLRRVRRGDELPRMNSLVDVINWCSFEIAAAVRPVRRRRIRGPVSRCGSAHAGERTPGSARMPSTSRAGLTLADDQGPFGNPDVRFGAHDGRPTATTPRDGRRSSRPRRSAATVVHARSDDAAIAAMRTVDQRLLDRRDATIRVSLMCRSA